MQTKLTRLIFACSGLVLTLSWLGCRQGPESSDIQEGISVEAISATRVEIAVTPINDKPLSLYIGNKKHASGLVKKNKTTLATLELSDQIQLEDGTLGHGIVFSRGGSKHFMPIVPDGVIPYGKVVIRELDAIVEAADNIVVADLEAENGTKLPISLKLE
ncbi:MAG: hypothetical protein HQ513_15840 [Rhodospirillales bacterium]|nr:hypothetical protein [Rhodospirillales bacterium]